MLKEEIIENLNNIVGEKNVHVDEPMSKHTTIRTGGNADYYVVPQSSNELISIVTFSRNNNIDYYLFGNGSNTLVLDKGIRGIVISFSGLSDISCDEINNEIYVGAGFSTIKATIYAKNHNMTGLEFACGIPGTIGGGIFMNAGAYGGEFKDIVKEVKCYFIKENITKTLSNAECGFDYRKSVFQTLDDAIILSCVLKLNKGNKEEIDKQMKENMASRSSKQPVRFPSAGSVFKREEGIVVAKLIDDAGLKGYKVGGAEVSNLHAGFIINTGNAKSQDVLDVIDHVKKVVLEKYNVTLHEEIKIIGEK